MPSSRGSSLPRDQTSLPCGFCIAGGFFTAELSGKPHPWHSPIQLGRNLQLLASPDGEGNGTPLQYSCLENPMDGGAWWAAVHGVIKSRTRLSDFTFTFHFHALEKEMATDSSALAWRIPGTGSLVGCRLWGRTELDTTEAT